MFETTMLCPYCGTMNSIFSENLPFHSTSILCQSCNKQLHFTAPPKDEEEQFIAESVHEIEGSFPEEFKRKSWFGSVFLIAFSLPLLKTAISNAMLALQPNIHGAGSKALFFALLGGIPFYFGVKGLIKRNKQ
ncbi:hypothetical protein HTZ97_00755 [Desulfuromonas acetoxidans]|mgnify:CR=1 FL=1|uniref:Uncharacterized protein n=1 Tax=Desulfuromonas acetoxidans (strain DSM 684 / 11070) TaxID=281689 RepID=Q1K4B7_DESA6|nr:hypothetical protein [Desulfuromonas acetoxidans]EAT17186.1 hypothetical protein Dace_3052 [Desulfuromonas acetoxidans DSM 684]MBF0645421.1 hypothetical protein [Desulfuromonas acetoxidans]NVD24227.1 hypothetical protein [Desulfuromonas acetoxidans]NVE15000.1 hypothetical protein [Desulfuromonas acetoxidans]